MVATGESIVFCLVRMYNLALIVILKLTETQVIKWSIKLSINMAAANGVHQTTWIRALTTR